MMSPKLIESKQHFETASHRHGDPSAITEIAIGLEALTDVVADIQNEIKSLRVEIRKTQEPN